jgi:NAD+ synthase (glutamine-hydrolysing)
VPFGNDLVFEADELAGLRDPRGDLRGPVGADPAEHLRRAGGATVLANLSASNITVGKAEYRRDLCAAQSGKCIAAYLYSAAGPGESTTDLAWDGHALIYENNDLLAESERFHDEEQMIVADVDLERLAQDRMRMTTFNDSVGEHRERVRAAAPGLLRLRSRPGGEDR